MAALHKLMAYSTLAGIYPKWHSWLFGPLSRFSWSGAGGRAYIMRYVQHKIHKHNLRQPSQDSPANHSETRDFLEKMIIAHDKAPEKVTDYHIYMMGLSNVVAGSDTTAISLSSILYHLLHYPRVLQKLRQEIDEFTAQGRCSKKVRFRESQDMPYLQAVIKESLRMHSATGLPLWRVVPTDGAEICGRFFPAGTVVGINTWVAHFNDEVFPNAATFRPERWTDADNNSMKLKAMNEMYMPVSVPNESSSMDYGLWDWLGSHSIMQFHSLAWDPEPALASISQS